jgi:phage shock protein A
MGIITRFRDIVGSNLNAMLDRAEDPEKLIRLMIQEMEDTLIELKVACTGVMAQSTHVERQLPVVEKRAAYWEDKAGLAVKKGRDDLAREALIEKRRYVQRAKSLANELADHQALLAHYKEDIRELEEKLKTVREKERLLMQRHIHAVRQKRAREEIRRVDSADAIFKFEEFEQRFEHMEAEVDLANCDRKSTLRDELEKLALEEDVASELSAIKTSSLDWMEKRVEALETLVDENERKETYHGQI